MFDIYDQDVVHLNFSPLVVALWHGGEYSLIVRALANKTIFCKNPLCQSNAKSCAHCEIYRGKGAYRVIQKYLMLQKH